MGERWSPQPPLQQALEIPGGHKYGISKVASPGLTALLMEKVKGNPVPPTSAYGASKAGASDWLSPL